MSILYKRETDRQAYIRILKMIDCKIEEKHPGNRDISLTAELIAAGHLKGITRPNEIGTPTANAVTGIGLSGRLLLQELKKAEMNESIWGRLRQAGDLIIGFLLGIAGTVAGAIVLHLLKLAK
jgi:hypothetical protein